jgi:hypothetical protein
MQQARRHDADRPGEATVNPVLAEGTGSAMPYSRTASTLVIVSVREGTEQYVKSDALRHFNSIGLGVPVLQGVRS